jgi:hypothetical protein
MAFDEPGVDMECFQSETVSPRMKLAFGFRKKAGLEVH